MDCLQELKQHYGASEGYALYRMIMEECFGLSHADILLGKDNQITEDKQARLHEITGRLLKNEPIQYILGYADFFGHRFHVAPGVLIPRPETELLVYHALDKAATLTGTSPVRILDIGTGSGCIAINMAIAGCQATAMDISKEALAIASDNADRHGVEVAFLQEDILNPSATARQWDLIVSNPPYVCLHEMEGMESNVLEYEPVEALFVPDYEPLIFYRAIASYALSHLTPGGWLCLEINEAFPNEMTELLDSFGFLDVTIIPDQYDKKRIALAHV